MRKALCGILLLTGTLTGSAQTVCLSTDFNRGIPSDYTLVCQDQLGVNTQDFTHTFPLSEWFSGEANKATGKVALSTSHRAYDLPTDNWMITPRLKVTAGDMWLTWNARSLHYDLRDGYKVMVSVTDTDPSSFEEIFSVEEEAYSWAHHLVSLDAYEGKEVYIAFVHNSQSKFLLAVDDIFVGQLAAPAMEARLTSKYFCGNVGEAPVTGTVRNIGCNTELQGFVLSTRTGETFQDLTSAGEFPTGTEAEFGFKIPVKPGEATAYELTALTAKGERISLLKDSIICSHYPRTLLLEKCTGTWCTSCPTVNPFIYELKERYKDELVCVEAHNGSYNLEWDDYFRNFGTANLPTIVYNRNLNEKQYSAMDVQYFENALKAVTVAEIKEASASYNDDGKIDLHVAAEIGSTLDNATGKYRIGYILVEKRVSGEATGRQKNGMATQVRYEQYYHLSTSIAPDLMFYHNVGRGSGMSFRGCEGSLPAQIEAGGTYDFDTTVEVPANVVDPTNLAVVVYVINSFGNTVLNSGITDVQGVPSAVEQVVADDNISITQNKVGGWNVKFPRNDRYTLSIYNTDGRLVKRLASSGNACALPRGIVASGCYLLKAQQGGLTVTKKIVGL